MLISRVIFILFISIIFSARDYNVIANNELDLTQDFTFEDLYALQNKTTAGTGTYGKLFSGGIYSNTFPFIKYLEVIEFKRRALNVLHYQTKDGIEIKVNSANFEEFRQNFLTRRCLKFEETAFPAKVFKIKSQDNSSEIEFLNRPDSKGEELDGDPNLVFYHVFAKKDIINSEGLEQTYFLLSSNESIRFKDPGKRILGWVLAYEEGDTQQVILWNTNLGVRPKADLQTDLKPLVFEQSSSGAISHSEYVESLVKTAEDIIIDEEGLELYHETYENNKGYIRRWLPSYLFEDNDYGIGIGVKDDYQNVRQDWLQSAVATKFNIVFIVDASMSMDFTWNSLRPVLDMTIKNLETQTVMNLDGVAMTPRFKVWAYHYNTQQINSEWVDTESNFDYASEIASACCTGSNGVRPVLYETLKKAIDDTKNETTYMIVVGDASDRLYPGKEFFDIPDLMSVYDPTIARTVEGIRIYSNTVHSAYEYGGPDFIDAYEEFESHFPHGLLYEVRGGAKDVMSLAEQQELAEQLTFKIKQELDDWYAVMENSLLSVSGKSTAEIDKKMQGKSRFSQAYIENLQENAKELKKGIGTFYDEGIIVSNDKDDKSLLNTDVLISEESLNDLFDVISEYTQTEDIEDAVTIIIQMLAIFFDVEYSKIDKEFLSETTIDDFWRKVVGNEAIATRLVPALFAKSNYTFQQVIDDLIPANEEKYLENCINISNNLIEQLDTGFGLFVHEPQSSIFQKFYWVFTEDLQLFRGFSF